MSDEMQRASEQPEAQVVPQQSQAPAEDLVKLVGPFFKDYTETEERKHQRAVELERLRIEEGSKQSRLMTIGVLVIIGIILLMAGGLFLAGRDASSFELIRLVTAMGGAFLGGYGVAEIRRRTQSGQ